MNQPNRLTYLVILFLICSLNVNNYFGYHSPSSIPYEYQNVYHLSSIEFGKLFPATLYEMHVSIKCLLFIEYCPTYQ